MLLLRKSFSRICSKEIRDIPEARCIAGRNKVHASCAEGAPGFKCFLS